MTKKHYTLIAQIIKECTNEGGLIDRNVLSFWLGQAFKASNPNFNQYVFERACGNVNN